MDLDPVLEGMSYADIRRDESLLPALDNANITMKRIVPVPGIDLGMLRARLQGMPISPEPGSRPGL